MINRNGKVHNSTSSFFGLISLVMVVWPRLCDPFASQNTIIIIIVIILILGRFSLEFEGQQTFSGLQDFSQYFH